MLRFECIVTVAPDGTLTLPPDVAARVRYAGLQRVCLVVTSIADELEMLEERGITQKIITEVATCGQFDDDIAVEVLRSEGSAWGTALEQRLSNFRLNS